MRPFAAVLTLLLFASAAHAAIPQAQRDALVALYDSTHGEAWTVNTGWRGAAGTECQWFGISCDVNNVTVNRINLFNNHLAGPIPSQLGNLPDLQVLDLGINPTTGSIPPELGNLHSLIELRLGGMNTITGTFPVELTHLPNLKSLQITGTQIGGAIPPELANLSALEELLIAGNGFTGSIPPALGQLSHLTTLGLSGNQLTGSIPPELGNLTALKKLQLSSNQLSGSLPHELGRLTALEELNIEVNSLSGPLPAELGSLHALRTFEAFANRLSGDVPSTFSGLTSLTAFHVSQNQLGGTLDLFMPLTNLQILSVGDNRFHGEIPQGIGALQKLQSLSLGLNQFSGPIPAGLATLTQLQYLEANANQFTGPLPQNLGDLVNLQILDFSVNRLTGPIPNLGRLTNLTNLMLDRNQMSGTLPPEIGSLTKLIELRLASNHFEGPIPDTWRNLVNLVTLTGGGNRISGSIPTWIGDLSNLKTLDFRESDLSGPLPASITKLGVDRFDFSYAGISGELPRDLGSMRSLVNFFVSGNQLSGTIPPSVGDLSNLLYLDLDGNQLTGNIPPEINNLHQLLSLSVGHNELEGPIPSLTGLTSLTYLGIGGNRYSGGVPSSLASLTSLQYLDLSSNALRGAMPPELMTLPLIDGFSDFGFNVLDSSDPALNAYLDSKMSLHDWRRTQTLAPKDAHVVSMTDRSATIAWTRIPFLEWDGGYQVVASLTAGGAPVSLATTASKYEDSIVVRGLAPGTQYFFTVSSLTFPTPFQKNLLISDPTPAFSATTTARVVSPADIVVTSPPRGLVEVDGVPTGTDSATFTNFGDATANVTLTKAQGSGGDFYQLSESSFAIAPGASHTVSLTSVTKPTGVYYGAITAAGGVTTTSAQITLLSIARPAGIVSAEAVTTRVELAGAAGANSVGTVVFRNTGTAPLSGLLMSDQEWVEAPRDPITIPPGSTSSINFQITRSKKPEGLGAFSANLTLVYVNGSGGSNSIIRSLDSGTSVSVSTVTVVDVTKPSTSAGTAPGLGTGELALFVPGLASYLRDGLALHSDLAITNASTAKVLSDLKMFFVPLAGGGASTVATLGSIKSSESVSLVNVVTNVYGATTGVGTLQIRSANLQDITAIARAVGARNGTSTAGDVPLFRSDRAAGQGTSVVLTGLREGADLYIQETSGKATQVTVAFLKANGDSARDPMTISLKAQELQEMLAAVPAGAVTVVIKNIGEGFVVAYGRVTDASGDTWSVVDWRRHEGYEGTAAVRIPYVEGFMAPIGSGGNRRRAAGHAVTSKPSSDITLFDPGTSESRARVDVIDAGGHVTSQDVALSSMQTVVLSGIASSPFAQVVITPTRGEIVSTCRITRTTEGGNIGTSIPVIPVSAGLRAGQSRVFSGIEDPTSATINAGGQATYRSALGLAETSGASVTLRASVAISETASLAVPILTQDYTLGPNQELVIDPLLRGLAGPSRDTAFPDLHALRLRLEVVSGKGSVVPFIVVTDNGSGDTVLRME